MDRRKLLLALSGYATFAGCTTFTGVPQRKSNTTPENDHQTESSTPFQNPTTHKDEIDRLKVVYRPRKIRRRIPGRDVVRATFKQEKITIIGKYTPPSACHDGRLDMTEFVDSGTLRITIGHTEENATETYSCPGGQVKYQLTITGEPLPEEVIIYHMRLEEEFKVDESHQTHTGVPTVQ